MAKTDGSEPLGGLGFGKSRDDASQSYDQDGDPQKTRAMRGLVANIKDSELMQNQRCLFIPGQHRVEEKIGTPPEYFYSQRGLSLLRQAIRRDVDSAFEKYGQFDLDKEWYESTSLREDNRDAIKDDLQTRVGKLERKFVTLKKAGNDQKKAGLTPQEYRAIQGYRDFVNEMMINDDKFAEEMDKLEKAWKNPTKPIIHNLDELKGYHGDYVWEILMDVENDKGSIGEQIETKRIIDENKMLVWIVNREIGAMLESDVQTFIGESYADHIYEQEHLDLLKQLGENLELTYEGKGIERLFEEDSLKAQGIVQTELARLESKHKKLQDAGKDPNKEVLKDRDMHFYGLYVSRKQGLDDDKTQGKLLEKSSPRHYTTYMYKLRKAQESFLEQLLKILNIGRYSPDMMKKVEDIKNKAEGHAALAQSFRRLKEASDSQAAENKSLQEQLAKATAEAAKFQKAYDTIVTALKKKVGTDKK